MRGGVPAAYWRLGAAQFRHGRARWAPQPALLPTFDTSTARAAATTTTTVNNPMGELVLTDDSAAGGSYRGTYGAAKGSAAQDVTVDTGDGEELTDAVKIIDQTGTVLVTIPYRELYTFHVITGEGDRKPGISFEHKPDPESKSGTPHVRALSIRHPTPSDLGTTTR